MERLGFDNSKYQSIEGSIHANRYLIVKNICRNKKVLDIACGEGYGSYLISKWGAKEVLGMDISKESVDKANFFFKNDNINFINGDAEDLKVIEHNQFDLIVSFETIEHLKEPKNFLKEIKRVAKPDAVIVISCPNDHFYYPTDDEFNPFHMKKYTLDEFLNMTEEVLGKYTNLFLGTPISGYVNTDIDDLIIKKREDSQLRMIEYNNDIESILLPNDHEINKNNCSYFMGIWGDFNKEIKNTLAAYPISMGANENPYRYTYIDDIRKINININELKMELENEIDKNIKLYNQNLDLNTIIEKKIIEIEELKKLSNKYFLEKNILELENKFLFENKNFLKGNIDYNEKIRILELELNSIYNSNGYKILSYWYRLKDKIKSFKNK